MSSEIAIKAENLSKRYEIYDRPRDRLLQSLFRGHRQFFREFWALQDISFELKKGETVGIIGRNGSGKSTLLQIVCGTLAATAGIVETSGRIAALLELGSGFNPEFTGRENVYLNGALMGLNRGAMDERFDSIDEFADIGDFIDQPVKTYSSGMVVRLAFAVIVHVDADVLVIDEALAVGDMYFQAKCMIHMKKLMAKGVTFLFVSHDVSAVKTLCEKAIYLDKGKIVTSGPVDEVVESYYCAGITSDQPLTKERASQHKSSNIPKKDTHLEDNEAFLKRAQFQRIQNNKASFNNVVLVDEHDVAVESVEFGQHLTLKMVVEFATDLPVAGLAYHIRDKNGLDIVYSDTAIEQCHLTDMKSGDTVVIKWGFNACLREGNYTIAAMLSLPKGPVLGQVWGVCDFVPIAVQFEIFRGQYPLYGATYWKNTVSQQRIGGLGG